MFECDTDHNDFFDEENRELMPQVNAFLERVAGQTLRGTI